MLRNELLMFRAAQARLQETPVEVIVIVNDIKIGKGRGVEVNTPEMIKT